MKIGDKIKVGWQKKVNGASFSVDATTAKWQNVTVDKIRKFSERENDSIIFTKEFPMCAVRIERCELI